MVNARMDEFKVTTHYITFRPKDIEHRLVEAARWCGIGVYAFIETAIKDRLYEIEAAMREEKDAGKDNW